MMMLLLSLFIHTVSTRHGSLNLLRLLCTIFRKVTGGLQQIFNTCPTQLNQKRHMNNNKNNNAMYPQEFKQIPDTLDVH